MTWMKKADGWPRLHGRDGSTGTPPPPTTSMSPPRATTSPPWVEDFQGIQTGAVARRPDQGPRVAAVDEPDAVRAVSDGASRQLAAEPGRHADLAAIRRADDGPCRKVYDWPVRHLAASWFSASACRGRWALDAADGLCGGPPDAADVVSSPGRW